MRCEAVVCGGVWKSAVGVSLLFVTNTSHPQVHNRELPMLPFTRVARATNVLPLTPRLLAPGATHILYSLTALATSLESPSDMHQRALATLRAASRDDAVLLQEHTTAWAARREQGHVQIAGNLELAQAVNASWYLPVQIVR